MRELPAVPCTPHSVREVLALLGVRPSKKRGQSFLASRRFAAGIARAADLGKEDAVLEIGAGLGALTAELLRGAGSVVAVENDRRLASWLRGLFERNAGFKLIEADALAHDIRTLIARMRKRARSVKVVSNIPYSISGGLIGKLLDEAPGVELLVLTVQDELARRITAGPGGKDYGAFSVFCQYHAEARRLFAVPASAFYPRPAVTSAVVAFRPRERPPCGVADREAFLGLVRLLFSQRRKAVNTLLRRVLPAAARGKLPAVLEQSGVEPLSRAEELGMGKLAALCDNLSGIAGVCFLNGASMELRGR